MSILNNLNTSFTTAVQRITKALITSPLLAAAITSTAIADQEVSPSITTTPSDSSGPIIAHEDSEILAACPQISDVELVTIPIEHIAVTSKITQMPPIPHSLKIEEVHPRHWLSLSSALFAIQRTAKDDKYLFVTDSIGGDISMGKMIYNHLINSPSEIMTISSSHAISFGSLILAAGDDRRLYEGTKFGVHEITLTDDNDNRISPQELTESEAKDLKVYNDWFKKQYEAVSTTGISPNCVEKIIQFDDVEVSAKTTLKLGWADIIPSKAGDTATVRKGSEYHAIYLKSKKEWVSDTALPTKAANDSNIIQPTRQRVASYDHP